jgi:hypothetical protein
MTGEHEKRSHGCADAKLIWGSANSVQNLAQEQLGAFVLGMVEEG